VYPLPDLATPYAKLAISMAGLNITDAGLKGRSTAALARKTRVSGSAVRARIANKKGGGLRTCCVSRCLVSFIEHVFKTALSRERPRRCPTKATAAGTLPPLCACHPRWTTLTSGELPSVAFEVKGTTKTPAPMAAPSCSGRCDMLRGTGRT